MKTLKLIFAFTFILGISSCSDSTDEDLGLSGEGSLTAKIDGSNFEALSVAVVATISNNVAAIQGSNSEGEYIRFHISNYNGVGTYTTGNSISNTNSAMYGTINPVISWVSTFDIGSGTIEITEEKDTAIKGTFSFTGINSDGNTTSKTITEGKFNAPKN